MWKKSISYKEGFCWTDINSTFLKARLKAKGVFDVVSMSLFTQTYLPDWYFVCLINTDLMSLYVDNFINNTSHFQINDARQTPVIIPPENHLKKLEKLFLEAHDEQILSLSQGKRDNTALLMIQKKIDEVVNVLYQI